MSRDILKGKIQNVTISRDALGWHISFACELAQDLKPALLEAVGIDRGVANTLAFSDGTFASLPLERMRLIERKKHKAQRALARAKKGSNRRRKVVNRAAKHSAKIARMRKHWHHEQSTHLAQSYKTIVMEDLKTSNMTKSAKGTIEAPGRNVKAKAGLNRSILEQGWYQFEGMLAYKLEARGGYLLKANPAYTSQQCSECQSTDKHNRKSQALFVCRSCGFEANADINAALNILRAGTRPTNANAPVGDVANGSDVCEARLAA